jgi:hypothetical protein
VGIGAKVVGGQRTSEPAIIVFLSRKRPLEEVSPDEVVPAEIDGIQTDVIEASKPRKLQLPDRHSYRDSGLDGGIQIQVAQDIFGGTLGCIARTDEPEPKIVAITNHHVVSPSRAVPSKSTLTVSSSQDLRTFTFAGTSTPELQVVLDFVIVPTGSGAAGTKRITYIPEAVDSPEGVATGLAILIELHPELQATMNVCGAQLTLVPASGFTVTASPAINRVFGDIDQEHGTVTIRGVPDPGLLLDLLVLIKDNPQAIHLFWLTSALDTLASIAQGIADGINAPRVENPFPITATVNGAVVTIAPILDAQIDVIVANTFPAHAPQPATLKAAITGHTITFTGSVSGDYYGVFTNVNTGGFDPSYGIFVAPKKGMNLSDLASSIATGLTSLHIPNAPISTPGNAQITITGAEEIECLVTSDVRVGQPDNSFPSSCLECMNNRIGIVTTARLDLDCALIQLDPGMKYKNEIEEIGIVSGTHTVTHDEATSHTYLVQKRGIATGWTRDGTIMALDVDGEMETGPDLFHRRYAGAMQIHLTGAAFSDEGDSGAAVLNSANEVVAILFGGNGGDTVATPIDLIQQAMEVIVQSTTADQKGKVFTVPQPSALHALAAARSTPAANMASLASTTFQAQLRNAEQQLNKTPFGRPFSMFVRHFSSELRSLINTNRRVAATWQRNGGPRLVQLFLAMLQRSDDRIPSELEGKPLADCIMNIQRVLAKYASPAFAAVLDEYGPRIAKLAGHNAQDLAIAVETQNTH